MPTPDEFITHLTHKLRASAATYSYGYTEDETREVLHELVDDRVAALIQNGTGIVWTYNDALGTLTGNVTSSGLTLEDVDDEVALLIQNGTGISWSYNDPGNTLTPTITLAPFSTTNLAEGTNLYYTDERVDDRVAVLIQNGTGISWAYNDPLNTLTPTVTLAPFSTTNLAEGTNLYFTDERVDDRVAALMISGTGTTWTYNDPGNTLKVDVSLSPFTTTNLAEGTNLYFTDERVDDRVAALMISGTGTTWTYNDPGNTLKVDVSLSPFTTTNLAEGANLYFTDERVDDRVAALIINTSTITWSYNDPGNSLSASVVADTSVQKVAVRKNSTGGDIGTRRRLNLIEGSNVTLTIADDGVDNEIDVTIASTGGGGSANIKQTEIDFGSTPVHEASFVVVDVDVTGGSQLLGQIAYEAPTGGELDDVEMDAFNLRFAPGSGQFTLFISSLEGMVTGKYKVNYLIG